MEILSGEIQLNRRLYWVIRYGKIMNDGTLIYTKKPGDNKPRGTYNIKECQITEEKDGNNQKIISIKVNNSKKAADLKIMLQKSSDHNKWFQTLLSFQNSNQQQQQLQNTLSLPEDKNITYNVNANIPPQNINITPSKKGSSQEYQQQQVPVFTQSFQIDVLDTQYLTQGLNAKDLQTTQKQVQQFLSGYSSDNFMLTSNQHNLQTFRCKKEQNKGDMIFGIGIAVFVIILVILLNILQSLLNLIPFTFSILITLNLILIPLISPTVGNYFKQCLIQENQQGFKIKGKGYISHNVNDILYVLTDSQKRPEFESNIKSVKKIQKNIFEVTHYDNTSEQFKQVVYQEGQQVIVVEYLQNKINRLFEIEINPCQQLGTTVNFYSITKTNGYLKKNAPEVIQGIDFYLKTEKANPQSPIYAYKPQNNMRQFQVLRSQNQSMILDDEDESEKIVPVQIMQSQIKTSQSQEIVQEETKQEQNDEQIQQQQEQQEKQQQEQTFNSDEHKKAFEVLSEKLESVDQTIELDSSWKKLEDKGSLKVHSKSMSDQGLTMSRGQQDINVPLKTLQEYIMDLNFKKEYDEMFKEGRKIEQLSDNIGISYNRMKGKMGVEDRDFCFVQGVFERNGKTYILGTSWEHPECPVVKGATRGKLIMGVWVLEALSENQTRGIYATMADPNGKIPDMIKNWAAKLQGFSVDKIKKIIEKKYPQ